MQVREALRLWQWMRSKGHSPKRVDRVWRDISDVVAKTLLSIQSTLAVNYNACKTSAGSSTPFSCFELLGFDILLTETLTPILIEVNHMPSYRTDSALDAQVKEGLITNTLELLNVSQNDRQRYLLRSACSPRFVCMANYLILQTARGEKEGCYKLYQKM